MSGLQLSTGRARPLPHPVRTNDKWDNGRPETGATEVKKTGGISASDAFISASHLEILNRFPRKAATCLGILAVLANAAGLIFLLHFFRTSCTLQFGVLPNDWVSIDTPESVARLGESDGVTIISTNLVYYQANKTFDQLGGTYWAPYAVTCGCDTCNLASCTGTTPISVEYEVCNGWGEVSAPLKNFVGSVIVRWYCCATVVVSVRVCVFKRKI